MSSESSISEPLLEFEESVTEDASRSLIELRGSIQRQQQQLHLSTSAAEEDEFPEVITRHATALAWAPTTSWLAKLLIPVLIVCTHALFLYGQTADMWRLTAVWEADVRYAAETTEARVAAEALELGTTGRYTIPETHKDIRTFTYVYAIQELWRAKHMPGVVLPRMAAGGLMLFSGLWPHLKLLMLLLTWWFARHPIRRRRALASLSVLGKWSLVDVLVVCVMVGVLNLQWNFTAVTVMQGVQDNLPVLVSLLHTMYDAEKICSAALKYSCVDPSKVKHILQCHACKTTVNTFFDHPDSAKMILSGVKTEGGGRGQLSVAGLKGIYAFCGAVILSILLSLAVDWYDHKSRLLLEQERESLEAAAASSNNEEQTTLKVTTAPEVSGTLSVTEDPTPCLDNSLHELLLAESGKHHHHRGEFRSVADVEYDRRILVESQQTGNRVWQGVSSVTALSVLVATTCITMERRVNGALPLLLHDILGVVWTKQYSFWLLGWTTGLAGGWDVMLMATFVLFIIAGPIVRSILCYRASRLTETTSMSVAEVVVLQRKKRNLSTWIDFIGAFCAWEVFTVAVFMVDLLMPSITSTIIMDKRCARLAQNSSSCLEVEFDMKKSYWLVIVGGFMLLLVSQKIRNFKTCY